MVARWAALIGIAGLAACGRFEPADGSAKQEQSCKMPGQGDAVSAAKAAIARGDYRLMRYWQNGEAAHDVVPGVRWALNASDVARTRANYVLDKDNGNRCARDIDVRIDEARSPGCCDIPWTPDACGVSQQDYAAAYNLALIGSPAFVKACGTYTPAPALR